MHIRNGAAQQLHLSLLCKMCTEIQIYANMLSFRNGWQHHALVSCVHGPFAAIDVAVDANTLALSTQALQLTDVAPLPFLQNHVQCLRRQPDPIEAEGKVNKKKNCDPPSLFAGFHLN